MYVRAQESSWRRIKKQISQKCVQKFYLNASMYCFILISVNNEDEMIDRYSDEISKRSSAYFLDVYINVWVSESEHMHL